MLTCDFIRASKKDLVLVNIDSWLTDWVIDWLLTSQNPPPPVYGEVVLVCFTASANPSLCLKGLMSDLLFFTFPNMYGFRDHSNTFWFLSLWFSPLSLLEYDTQLAPAGASESDMASSSYLEPNHNHSGAGGCGVKSRSGMPSGTGVGTSGSAGGLERAPGSMDRVLKIFHYFETNSEPCTWASNIRHGDATDVRVRHTNVSLSRRPTWP